MRAYPIALLSLLTFVSSALGHAIPAPVPQTSPSPLPEECTPRSPDYCITSPIIKPYTCCGDKALCCSPLKGPATCCTKEQKCDIQYGCIDHECPREKPKLCVPSSFEMPPLCCGPDSECCPSVDPWQSKCCDPGQICAGDGRCVQSNCPKDMPLPCPVNEKETECCKESDWCCKPLLGGQFGFCCPQGWGCAVSDDGVDKKCFPRD